MLRTRVFALACAVGVFVCLMAARVSAQPRDHRTLFTFSGPVTLAAVTRPAGQYLFQHGDAATDSKVVQVLNTDGTSQAPLVAVVGTITLFSAASLQSWGTPRR